MFPLCIGRNIRSALMWEYAVPWEGETGHYMHGGVLFAKATSKVALKLIFQYTYSHVVITAHMCSFMDHERYLATSACILQ